MPHWCICGHTDDDHEPCCLKCPCRGFDAELDLDTDEEYA